MLNFQKNSEIGLGSNKSFGNVMRLICTLFFLSPIIILLENFGFEYIDENKTKNSDYRGCGKYW